MEDDHNLFENGRRPEFFCEMENDLNFLGKSKTTSIIFLNGRRPQMFFVNDFFLNGRQPHFFEWKTKSIFSD